jgi:hypothetical protein
MPGALEPRGGVTDPPAPSEDLHYRIVHATARLTPPPMAHADPGHQLTWIADNVTAHRIRSCRGPDQHQALSRLVGPGARGTARRVPEQRAHHRQLVG